MRAASPAQLSALAYTLKFAREAWLDARRAPTSHTELQALRAAHENAMQRYAAALPRTPPALR